jgi:serine/arginine repetitive matrix protein 2
MYNGVGVRTPRGTGTSGRVWSNLAHIKRKRVEESSLPFEPPKTLIHGNKDILEHERKRQIEIKCIKLHDELEEQGLDQEHIEKQVDVLRKTLMQQSLSSFDKHPKQLQEHQTHELVEAKQHELKKIQRALGIKEETHVVGRAFERELQQPTKKLPEQPSLRQKDSEHKRKKQVSPYGSENLVSPLKR